MLEDLEFAIHPSQLERILKNHNNGMTIEEISKIEKRDPFEIIIALLHIARRTPHKIKRPLAYRKRVHNDSF